MEINVRASLYMIFQQLENLPFINNCRQINIQKILNKVIEIIVNWQLTNSLTENKFISANQYGFRQNSNPRSEIFDLLSIAQKEIDNNVPSSIVFLDNRKAFDTVCRDRLVKKLEML